MTPLKSPIEWKFAAAVKDVFDPTFISYLPSSDLRTMLQTWDDDAVHLYACAPQVRCGPHRVDFLFIGFCCEVNPAMVAVECDGHEFHERTKEQAARDKARDRDLARMGIHVMRFTGSEVHRNPAACAREVQKLLDLRCFDAMAALHPKTFIELGIEAGFKP